MKKLFNPFMVAFLVMVLVSGSMLGLIAMEDQAQAAPLMARGSITPTDLTYTGTTQSLSTANGDGHKFQNTGDQFIVVKNDYTATITMTVVTGGQFAGFDIDDVDVAVISDTTQLVGPFNVSVFNRRSGGDIGYIYLNWNTEVTGTVANSVTLNVYTMD